MVNAFNTGDRTMAIGQLCGFLRGPVTIFTPEEYEAARAEMLKTVEPGSCRDYYNDLLTALADLSKRHRKADIADFMASLGEN
jgi:hypothetical protein